MQYIKIFEDFTLDIGKDSLENGINTILLPIYDFGYRFNIGYLMYPDSIIVTILSGDDSDEEYSYIKGVEIKENVLTLIDFLKKKSGNDSDIFIWSNQDYSYIDISDVDQHGVKDFDDLKADYAETDAIRIITKLI